MAYLSQVTVLFYLILFLQAFRCKTQADQPAPIPVSAKDLYKMLELNDDDQAEEEDPDSGYDSDPKPIENDGPKKNKKRQSTPGHKKDKEYFDFENTIQILCKIADVKRGIRWNLSGDRLIREVVDSGNSLYAAEDYAVQIVNIYRAAKKMCVLYGKDSALFVKMANKFMQNYKYHQQETEDFWIKEVKNTNHIVVSKLHQMVLTDDNNENANSINKKLRLAENYVGLDDRHYDVTTTFKVEDKKFALEDTKWLKLTEEQKLEFINRKSKAWYTRLEPFEQKLIDAYLDKFLDGQHYLPTQIRNIPGCRNAYQKRILAYDQNNNQTVLGRYYHSGALVSLIQDTDPAISEQITQENWKQVLQHVQDVEVLSLNHNVDLTVPLVGNIGEQHIVEVMKHIVGEDRFIYLPINHIGTFTTPIFKPQVNKLLEESKKLYQNKYPTLRESSIKNKKENRLAEVDQIKDAKDKRYSNRLELLKEAAERTNNINKLIHNGIQVYNNYYAHIGANYIACKAILGQATSTSSVLFSCKSGKDRTGLMSYLVDGNIICMNHPALDVDKGSKVYTALAYAAHPQFLASVNGGMPGRFGMKPVRGNEITYNLTQPLFPKAAQSTEIDLNAL